MRITEPADILSVIIDLAEPPHALSFPQDALREIAAQRLYKAVHNDGAPRCSEFLEALRDFRHTCQRTGEHQNAVRVVDILTKPGAFFRPLDTELLKTFENWVYETFPHQSRREWAAGRIVRLALAMRGWEASNIVDQSFRTATLRDVMAEIAMRGIPGAIADLPRLGVAIDGQYVDEAVWAGLSSMVAGLPSPAATFWLQEYGLATGQWVTHERLEALAAAVCREGQGIATLHAVMTVAALSGVEFSGAARGSMLQSVAASGTSAAVDRLTYLVQALDATTGEIEHLAQSMAEDDHHADVRRGVAVLLSARQVAERSVLPGGSKLSFG